MTSDTDSQYKALSLAVRRGDLKKAIGEKATGSSKTLSADVRGTLASYLGQQVLPPEGSGAMKATVMARLRGPGCTVAPKHNKYSGIQEWANAVALFVNVCGKTGSVYSNTFSQVMLDTNDTRTDTNVLVRARPSRSERLHPCRAG